MREQTPVCLSRLALCAMRTWTSLSSLSVAQTLCSTATSTVLWTACSCGYQSLSPAHRAAIPGSRLCAQRPAQLASRRPCPARAIERARRVYNSSIRRLRPSFPLRSRLTPSSALASLARTRTCHSETLLFRRPTATLSRLVPIVYKLLRANSRDPRPALSRSATSRDRPRRSSTTNAHGSPIRALSPLTGNHTDPRGTHRPSAVTVTSIYHLLRVPRAHRSSHNTSRSDALSSSFRACSPTGRHYRPQITTVSTLYLRITRSPPVNGNSPEVHAACPTRSPSWTNPDES
ncbi:hypothetical protein C8Q80DRAFT_1213033 [Daedaleopsis nitida]|nr:hypothetical protein C8Q80DRAFT_1213033 [Daedaleopsis nitida]